jgi:tetratricopeptide (TPR) repeat protein
LPALACPKKEPAAPPAPPAAAQPADDSEDEMDASYLADLAQVHLNHQKHEMALGYLDRALAKETDPARRARLQMRVGEVYDQLGRKDDATRAYEQAGDKVDDPAQRALLMLRLGQSYRRAGKLAEASDALGKVLSAETQPYVRDSARSELIQVWHAQGALAQRVAEFEARVKKAPDDVEAIRVLGMAYATALAKPDKAIPYYQKLVAADPGQFGLSWQLGNLYFQARQFDEGVAYFRKLAEQMPARKAELNERVASGYASLGKKQDALTWAEKMVSEAADKTPHLFIQQAHLFGRIAEDARALQSFQKAIDAATGQPQRQQFRYDLASFLVARKKFSEGKAALEQLLSEDLAEPLKKQATTLLETVDRQMDPSKAAPAPAPAQAPAPAPRPPAAAPSP